MSSLKKAWIFFQGGKEFSVRRFLLHMLVILAAWIVLLTFVELDKISTASFALLVFASVMLIFRAL